MAIQDLYLRSAFLIHPGDQKRLRMTRTYTESVISVSDCDTLAPGIGTFGETAGSLDHVCRTAGR